jgi:hypothetical protein
LNLVGGIATITPRVLVTLDVGQQVITALAKLG